MKSEFSWSDAMLSGSRVLRREPAVLLLWSLVGLVFGVIDQLVAVYAEVHRGGAPGGLWIAPMAGLGRSVVAVVGIAIFSAAVYRAVLRSEGGAPGRMRIGADEVRLTLVWLLQGLLLLVLTIAAMISAFAVSTLIFKDEAMLAAIVNGVVILGAFGAWLVLLVRLSLAAPMALAEGRWSGPAAWRLTKGRGWKILAVHLPLLLGVGLVFSVSRTLYLLALSATGVDLASMFTAKARSVAEVFAPARLGFTIITAILGAIAAALIYAPAAYIYRALKGDEPADQASVFD